MFLQKLHRRHRPRVDKITSQMSIRRGRQDDPKSTNKYLHGRPGPRMWCPHVIGRDGWVWVEQRALRKREFPPQGGGERPDWRRATRREKSTGGVRV